MVRAGGLTGKLYVLEDEGHEMVSIALWYPPGKRMFATDEERELGYNEFLSKLDGDTLDWWHNSYGPVTQKFVKKHLAKSPVDCWWLNILATDPNHQRKGYATDLLQYLVGNIPSPNLIGFCSTSEDNATFYTKLGFPCRGRMEMTSRFGGFPVFAHSREI